MELPTYACARYVGGGGATSWNASVNAGSGLNLRVSPATSATNIHTLPNGTRVKTIGSSGDWTRVTCSYGTGWVSTNYLNIPRIVLEYEAKWGREFAKSERTIKTYQQRALNRIAAFDIMKKQTIND